MSVYRIAQVGAFLLLIANMIVSYAHAYDLIDEVVRFKKEWLTHVMVISLDIVFILSVLILNATGGRGKPPWTLFLFGLSFTGWSNIRPAVLDGNFEGIIINGLTVLALGLIKWNLNWMDKNKALFVGETSEPNQIVEQKDSERSEQTEEANSEPLTTEQIEPIEQEDNEQEQTNIVQLPKRMIGFISEQTNTEQRNGTKSEQAYQEAVRLYNESNEIPKVREVANIVQCSVSTASKAIKQLREEIAQ